MPVPFGFDEDFYHPQEEEEETTKYDWEQEYPELDGYLDY